MYVDGVVPFPGDLICCIAEWKCVQYGQGFYDEETGQCLISGALTRVGSRDDQSECLGGRYIDDKGLCYFEDRYTQITPARSQSDCWAMGGIYTGCGGGKCLRK